MAKRLMFAALCSTLALSLSACNPAQNEQAPELPDFSSAPFVKVQEGSTVSNFHPEWGQLKAALYSSTGPVMEVGGKYVVVYLNEDGSNKYAEYLSVKSETEATMYGFTYQDSKFVFEKQRLVGPQ